ncbi:NADH-quinone oxidoreductase subunit D-related protein [Kozakia baliensis]|nr:hypothetical protein [Kozakia baliensis]GBR27545.1 NADH-ubiquinone oxidoreductase subunit 49kDa [Kozakia baliensis NRIC 0488]GEL64198.1 hydrogenase expression protein HypE [Kozakia baliensis]
MSMADIIRTGERVAPAHYELDEAQWRAMIDAAPLWFIAHWCDDRRAYALFLERERPLLASTALSQKRYFALSSRLPAASWPERIAQDLWGTQPLDAADTDPALDHGFWTRGWPWSSRSGPGAAPPPLRAEDEPFRDRTGPFALNGPTLKLGFSHRGLLQNMHGLKPEEALRFVGRATASGFVAHALAYSRAIEQAVGVRPTAAARDGRSILSEIERISVHLRDIAATARLTGAGLLATHAELAEDLLAELCLRHGASRRLLDSITPEGIAPGIEAPPLAQAAYTALMPRLPLLDKLHRQFSENLRRIGLISLSQIEALSIGGLTGRASGRSFDLRQHEDDMRHVPGRAGSLLAGDAWARERLRLAEIRDSLRRIERIGAGFAAELPAPPMPPVGSGEGFGAVEGAHGDIWYWVRLREEKIDTLYARDPALSLLPALPALLRHETAPELALASFGFSPSGAEL